MTPALETKRREKLTQNIKYYVYNRQIKIFFRGDYFIILKDVLTATLTSSDEHLRLRMSRKTCKWNLLIYRSIRY